MKSRHLALASASKENATVRDITYVLPPGLLVVHNTGRGGKDDLSERTGGQQDVDPVLDGVKGDVESGRDNTSLVQSSVELDNDLSTSVVVDKLELADVA
jgi:hypothetical protein